INLTKDDCEKIRNKEITYLSLGINGNRVLDNELNININIIPDTIKISDGLDYSINNNIITIVSNIIGNDKECYIEMTKEFIIERFYFNVIGKKINDPKIINELTYKIDNSKLYIDYNVYENDLIKDISYALVYQDDILLYKIDKYQFINILKTDIDKSFIIKSIYQTTESKKLEGHIIKTRVINNNDINNEIIIDDLKGYELKSHNHLYMKHIKPLYLGDECPNFVKFDINNNELPFTYSVGTDNAKGIKGLLYTSRGAGLIYPIKDIVNSLNLDFLLGVEKASGEGFGSANGQYLELFMNYDDNTLSGIALRLERQASTDKGVFMSIRKYVNGVNHIIGNKILTKKYLTDCHIIANYANNILTFKLELYDNADSLSINLENLSSSFMIRSTGTIGVGNRFLIRKIKHRYE
ncbi:MAG: hypothetical protein IJA65_03380, partial [Acholeplasmatales bacterium]|nr:hypothetical protein [Acholeplasmatales bacterium]